MISFFIENIGMFKKIWFKEQWLAFKQAIFFWGGVFSYDP